MYYVYIIKSSKQFYIGYTADLRSRIQQHLTGKSVYTKSRGPWKLVYYEASIDEKSTRERERYLKTAWGRRYWRQRIS